MGKPIGQAHRKGKKTGNGSRKSAKRPVETVDENGGDSRPQFITPPAAKKSRTILTDNTNTVSTNITIFLAEVMEFKSYYWKLVRSSLLK